MPDAKPDDLGFARLAVLLALPQKASDDRNGWGFLPYVVVVLLLSILVYIIFISKFGSNEPRGGRIGRRNAFTLVELLVVFDRSAASSGSSGARVGATDHVYQKPAASRAGRAELRVLLQATLS
jgi:hypothetical protein